MLRILYLAHDLSDPAIRRRVLALQTGQADVTLAGFRRGENAGAAMSGIETIELGATEDARFVQRAGAVAKACMHLSAKLRGVVKPDIVIARNLEMLAVARRAVSLFGEDIPVVYECLDIHRLLLRQDIGGRMLRAAEGRLGRGISLLITSSPAYVENYFQALSSIDAPVMLLENKVLELGDSPLTVPEPRPPAQDEPWKIGWFGALRCRKSLDLLSRFSRAMEGKVEVIVRGRPAYTELKDFDSFMRGEPYMNFCGAYRNPEDLSEIYGEVQFTWAIDFFEEGLNSAWLLPNRIYEGCRYGTVPIAIDGTETARFIARKDIGFVLKDASVDALVDMFSQVDRQRYVDAATRIVDQGAAQWTFRRDDCIDLVRRLSTIAKSGERSLRSHTSAQAATLEMELNDR